MISSSPSSAPAVACPMECGATFLKPFLPLHTSLACANSLVPCAHKRAGCTQLIRRQDMRTHALLECGFRGASAGLEQLERSVLALQQQTAELSAAMGALPSQVQREEEALAEGQLLRLPLPLVAQVRAWLDAVDGREWSRLSWRQRLQLCSAFVEEHKGAALVYGSAPAGAQCPIGEDQRSGVEQARGTETKTVTMTATSDSTGTNLSSDGVGGGGLGGGGGELRAGDVRQAGREGAEAVGGGGMQTGDMLQDVRQAKQRQAGDVGGALAPNLVCTSTLKHQGVAHIAVRALDFTARTRGHAKGHWCGYGHVGSADPRGATQVFSVLWG